MQSKSKSEALQLAADMLQRGQWDAYLTQVKLAYSNDEDKIWGKLVKQLPETFSIFDILSVQSSLDDLAASRWLLPIVGKLSHLSLSDSKKLLYYADTLKLGLQHLAADQLRPHIAARSQLGQDLGEYLRAGNTQNEASLLVWAGAFALGAPNAAIAYLRKLLTGVDIDTRLAAVLTTFLPVDDHAVQQMLASFERELIEIISGSTTALGNLAWNAMCHIASQSITARSALRDALHAGRHEATISIANSLYRNDAATACVTGETVPELVDRLLQVGLIDDVLRPFIDGAVESLFYRPTLCLIATQSIMKLGTVTNDVVAVFPETFGALANHCNEFASILTDWLLKPDTSFASLRSLISMCTNSRAPIVLDEQAFAGQSQERRLKAARRLLALTHNGPTLCEFCALIAGMTMLGSERFNLAGQMLDKTFGEYPGATEEFLKAKTSTLSTNAPETHVYQDIYSNVLQWRSVLENLPKRMELKPSDSELQVLRARKGRINREILRIASEHSIFSRFTTNLHIAQGKKFASHTVFGSPQISHMTESSHFVELPSSELADPMRGQIDRHNLLGSAR